MEYEPNVVDRISELKVTLEMDVHGYKKFWLATRNCYFKGTLEDLENSFTFTKARKLLKSIIDRRHDSCLEHFGVYITLEGVSRSYMAQITRHRHVTFHISSQHFQKHQNFMFVMPELKDEPSRKKFLDMMEACNNTYNDLVENGTPHFIARQVLPNAASCKIIMSLNLRELRHIIKLRQGAENTPETQKVTHEIIKHLKHIEPAFLYKLEDL